MKAISLLGVALGSQLASASMSSGRTVRPSWQRRRFSSRILSENGSRAARMRASHGVEAKDGVVAIADAELRRIAELLVHDDGLSRRRNPMGNNVLPKALSE